MIDGARAPGAPSPSSSRRSPSPGLLSRAGLLAFLEAAERKFFYALVLADSLTAPPVVAGLQSLPQFLLDDSRPPRRS